MRISDWSSDVCSSDLPRPGEVGRLSHALLPRARRAAGSGGDASGTLRARQGDAGLRRQGHRPQPGRRPAGLSHEGIEGGDGAMTATPPLTTPPLTTPLCRLLGCRYPILQAGMGGVARSALAAAVAERSEEHTAELQSLMRIAYAVF